MLAVPHLFCLPSTIPDMGINYPTLSTQAGEFPLESVANGILDAQLKHGKNASTTPSSHFLCRDSRCGCGMLAHEPQQSKQKTKTKTTWQRKPALPLPAEPETTADDSTLLARGRQFVPEPAIQHREPGHWIKLYQLSVTNDQPQTEEGVRSESSFNSKLRSPRVSPRRYLGDTR